MLNPRFFTLTGMILFTAGARLLPHPWNLTPVGAFALFAGARFLRPLHAYAVTFAALLLSDAALGLYGRMPVIYLGWAAVIGIGLLLRRRSGAGPIAAGLLTGSTAFYLLTNFGVWATGTLYPITLNGLIACYAAGLPFYRNMVAGDLFYGAVLFGSFHWAARRFPALQRSTSAA